MKKYIKDFCVRGMMFAWGGPFILAIVWLCLKGAGVITTLTIDEAVLGIISTIIMAFVAAGISIVYQVESLPKTFAGLIQMSVLYIDYIGFYLLNGWLPFNKIWIFTLIFLVVFVVIWLSIFIPIKRKVDNINIEMKQ